MNRMLDHMYCYMTTKSEKLALSWQNEDVRKRRSASISKAQRARREDMSRISKELWTDPAYRENMTGREPANKIPEHLLCIKTCLQCLLEFKCLPCRKNYRKFCSKDCTDIFKRNKPNFKNRGKIPSPRCGYGLRGRYNGKIFRSLYELSFIINILEANNLSFEYESIKIELPNQKTYIPDFVCHQNKTIYEVKYEKALKENSQQIKFEAGEQYAKLKGYTFEIYTEKRIKILTQTETAKLIINNQVTLFDVKHKGAWRKNLEKKVQKLTYESL